MHKHSCWTWQRKKGNVPFSTQNNHAYACNPNAQYTVPAHSTAWRCRALPRFVHCSPRVTSPRQAPVECSPWLWPSRRVCISWPHFTWLALGLTARTHSVRVGSGAGSGGLQCDLGFGSRFWQVPFLASCRCSRMEGLERCAEQERCVVTLSVFACAGAR